MVCLTNFVGTCDISNFILHKIDKFIEFLDVPNGKINIKVAILNQVENFGFTASPSVAIIKAP